MRIRTRRAAHALSISALALSASILPAAAQTVEPAGDSDTTEEVVVTGSNIRGAQVVGSPVMSIGAEDIARSGKATVAELMRELPVNFAGGVGTPDNNRGGQDNTSSGSNLTGGSGVNLRGLGALSTLVLVNGRRVAVSGQFGDFVDISNIPVASIERIEILQDGASAVYGSDAVGGVVNIVLKKRADGLTALARVGTFTKGGEMEYQGSLTWGTSWSGGSFVAGYEYNRRDNILADDRGFNGGDFSDRGGVNWPRYQARAGTAANIFIGGASQGGTVGYTVPQGANSNLTIAQLNATTGGFGNTYNTWEMVDIMPSMERHSAFANIEAELSPGLTVHAGGRYTHRTGRYNTGYPVLYSTVPTTNPAYIAGVSNNFGVVIDDLSLHRDVRVDSIGLEAGLRYELFGDWAFDLTGSFSRETQNRSATALRDTSVIEKLSTGAFTPSSVACSLQGSLPAVPTAAQAFCGSLGYATFNPYSTQPLSSQLISQLIGNEDLTFYSQVWQGTAKVDGTLIDLPGGALKIAAGVDYREEAISGLLNFNHRSIKPQSVPYGGTNQRVFAAFSEAEVPIFGPGNNFTGMESLIVSAAVRHERARGLRPFNTTDPKFGVKYEPVKGFALRASWGTSFHAPPMRFQYNGYQPVAGGNAIFYANAFHTAPCNTTLVALNGFTGTPGGSGQCSFTSMVVSGGAGPTLRPERAETLTLGADFAPPVIPGLRLGFNYFNLTIKDRLVRITSGALSAILAEYFATGTSPYLSNLSFNPGLAEQTALFNDPRLIGLQGPGPQRVAGDIGGIIYATQTNLAALKTSGFDFTAAYGFAVGPESRLNLFGNATIVSEYRIQATPGQSFVSRLNQYDPVGAPVSFKARGGFELTHGGASFGATVNHVGSYKCSAACYVPNATGAPTLQTKPIGIGSWTTFDLQLGYEFGEGGGALGGTRLALVVLNAFDQDPPFVDTGRPVQGNFPEPYDGANGSVLGRSISLTVTKRF